VTSGPSLHNRRAFLLVAEQLIKAAVRAERPVIALFLDVDHLKVINGTYGHAEGDRALRLVADALRGACRDSDVIGRISGDEFGVLRAEAQAPDGVEGRIRASVAAPVVVVGHSSRPFEWGVGRRTAT
jgi:diguanylate cyclase (GGDEF)-like protein